MKMWGMFFNSATANGLQNALLIPFYCLILKQEPLPEQLRLSSLVMVVFGFGSVIGGPILGYVNDKLGGDRAVCQTSILL